MRFAVAAGSLLHYNVSSVSVVGNDSRHPDANASGRPAVSR